MLKDTQSLFLNQIQPFIRYVNNYKPTFSYIEMERIIFDYELMYVIEGSVDIFYEQKIYHLNKSDIFYFRPNVKNYMIVKQENNFRTHCIHFDWTKLPPEYDFTAEEFYMHTFISKDYKDKVEFLKTRPNCEPADFYLPVHIQKVPYEKFAVLFAQCYHTFICKTPISQLKMLSLFYDIVFELAQINSCTLNNVLIHPKITYAIDYIKSNYTKSLSVVELAEKYSLSPKYFGALFKSATGKTINEFIMQLRIFAAKEMLVGTTMSIDYIAEKTGFSNSFYFSKCFKDSEKISPSKYRCYMTKN